MRPRFMVYAFLTIGLLAIAFLPIARLALTWHLKSLQITIDYKKLSLQGWPPQIVIQDLTIKSLGDIHRRAYCRRACISFLFHRFYQWPPKTFLELKLSNLEIYLPSMRGFYLDLQYLLNLLKLSQGYVLNKTCCKDLLIHLNSPLGYCSTHADIQLHTTLQSKQKETAYLMGIQLHKINLPDLDYCGKASLVCKMNIHNSKQTHLLAKANLELKTASQKLKPWEMLIHQDKKQVFLQIKEDKTKVASLSGQWPDKMFLECPTDKNYPNGPLKLSPLQLHWRPEINSKPNLWTIANQTQTMLQGSFFHNPDNKNISGHIEAPEYGKIHFGLNYKRWQGWLAGFNSKALDLGNLGFLPKRKLFFSAISPNLSSLKLSLKGLWQRHWRAIKQYPLNVDLQWKTSQSLQCRGQLSNLYLNCACQYNQQRLWHWQKIQGYKNNYCWLNLQNKNPEVDLTGEIDLSVWHLPHNHLQPSTKKKPTLSLNLQTSKSWKPICTIEGRLATGDEPLAYLPNNPLKTLSFNGVIDVTKKTCLLKQLNGHFSFGELAAQNCCFNWQNQTFYGSINCTQLLLQTHYGLAKASGSLSLVKTQAPNINLACSLNFNDTIAWLPYNLTPINSTYNQDNPIEENKSWLLNWPINYSCHLKTNDPATFYGPLGKAHLKANLFCTGNITAGQFIGQKCLVSGSVKILDGKINVFGHRLQLLPSNGYFDNSPWNNPWLEGALEGRIRGHKLHCRIFGPARNFAIDLHTDPYLEQGQALSLLLTGYPNKSLLSWMSALLKQVGQPADEGGKEGIKLSPGLGFRQECNNPLGLNLDWSMGWQTHLWLNKNLDLNDNFEIGLEYFASHKTKFKVYRNTIGEIKAGLEWRIQS